MFLSGRGFDNTIHQALGNPRNGFEIGTWHKHTHALQDNIQLYIYL